MPSTCTWGKTSISYIILVTRTAYKTHTDRERISLNYKIYCVKQKMCLVILIISSGSNLLYDLLVNCVCLHSVREFKEFRI